jgi:integrase-like protein
MAAVGLDPRYATHSCRHRYATHLYRASGADLEVVQEQLGHASIKTTTIYARVTKEDKLQAANALGKAFGVSHGKTRGRPTPVVGSNASRKQQFPPASPPASSQRTRRSDGATKTAAQVAG